MEYLFKLSLKVFSAVTDTQRMRWNNHKND